MARKKDDGRERLVDVFNGVVELLNKEFWKEAVGSWKITCPVEGCYDLELYIKHSFDIDVAYMNEIKDCFPMYGTSYVSCRNGYLLITISLVY